jgi:hypothetical protein
MKALGWLWMLFWCLLVLLFTAWPLIVFANPVDVAETWADVREATNHNDAPEIDDFLAWQGLGPGYPWCQAFAAWCIDADAGKRVMPQTASVHQGVKWALRNRLTVSTLTPRAVLVGASVPRGAVVAFKHGPGADAETFTGNGHAALAVHWKGPKGRTIEGNTKPGEGGDQRGASTDLSAGHDGVYWRDRALGLAGTFPVVLFYWPRGQL